MPELPEVETIRRALVGDLVGRTVTGVTHHPSAKFSSAALADGARFTSLSRRGKYLIAGLTGRRELIVHLGMTGVLTTRGPGRDPYVRARWDLDDGHGLVFTDVRRFGRIGVVNRGDYVSLPTLDRLGPEPLSGNFTPETLWRALRSSNVRVKTQLLSQRPVAGVGNIYADEALWRAELHPALRRITRAQATRLHRTIRAVLCQGLLLGGTTLRDYRTPDGSTGANQHRLDCYGRSGEPCRRCGTDLVGRLIDARSTTMCPRCQAR